MLSDTLWNLINSGMFDTTGPVNNALIGSIATILESQYDNGEELLNNLSPKTADLIGIAIWEQILGIQTNSSYSLAQRQSIASAKAYRLAGSLTKQQLVDILNLFSPTNSAKVVESPSTYQVYGTMLASEVTDMNSLMRMVKDVLPAHLQFIPVFIAVVLTVMQIESNNRVVVKRVAAALSDRNLLTGTWKLDGSVIMNRSAYPVTITVNGKQV